MSQPTFETLEVMRALGLAPSTAAIAAGLLNGKVDPDNFRSLQEWPMNQFGDLPPQHVKVLAALTQLLEAERPSGVILGADGTRVGRHVDLEDVDFPTVIWDTCKAVFVLSSVRQFLDIRYANGRGGEK